jgi:hypothetical protein
MRGGLSAVVVEKFVHPFIDFTCIYSDLVLDQDLVKNLNKKNTPAQPQAASRATVGRAS